MKIFMKTLVVAALASGDGHFWNCQCAGVGRRMADCRRCFRRISRRHGHRGGRGQRLCASLRLSGLFIPGLSGVSGLIKHIRRILLLHITPPRQRFRRPATAAQPVCRR